MDSRSSSLSWWRREWIEVPDSQLGLMGRCFLVLCSVLSKRVVLEEDESCYLYVFIICPVTCGPFSSLPYPASHNPDSMYLLRSFFLFPPCCAHRHAFWPANQPTGDFPNSPDSGQSVVHEGRASRTKIERHVGRNTNHFRLSLAEGRQVNLSLLLIFGFAPGGICL
jgi:hypothetical protein